MEGWFKGRVKGGGVILIQVWIGGGEIELGIWWRGHMLCKVMPTKFIQRSSEKVRASSIILRTVSLLRYSYLCCFVHMIVLCCEIYHCNHTHKLQSATLHKTALMSAHPSASLRWLIIEMSAVRCKKSTGRDWGRGVKEEDRDGEAPVLGPLRIYRKWWNQEIKE